MGLYPENNKLSEKTEEAYVSVKKKSHRILKMYVGVNGKSQLFYDATGSSTPTNITYLYNEGDECVDITGGWKTLDYALIDLISHNKGNNHLYIYHGAVSTNNSMLAGFITVNDCLPTETGYRIGIEYSFVCNEPNNEDFCFVLSRSSGSSGNIISEYITSPSSSTTIKETNYTVLDKNMGQNNKLSIELLCSNYSDYVYYPTTTLKIYKVWYEPYDETTS